MERAGHSLLHDTSCANSGDPHDGTRSLHSRRVEDSALFNDLGCEKGTVTFSSFLRARLGSGRRQNRNNLLILMTRPRFRRSQPRSGRKPPVTSRSSV